jgi:hypothetical protein
MVAVALGIQARDHRAALQTVTSRLEEYERTERARQTAERLRRAVNRLRQASQSNASDANARRKFDAACRAIWVRRQEFLSAAAPDAGSKQSVHDDLLDMARLWADGQSRERAAEILAEAERDLGSRPSSH